MDIDFLQSSNPGKPQRVSLIHPALRNSSSLFVGCVVRYSDAGRSRIAVRVNHESRVFSRGEKGVIDELSSRRSRFQPGIPICLANGQEWTFPAPAVDSDFLIGLNYELSSTDLANLFTFQPRSQELTNSQHAFESLARDHILSLARRGKLPLPAPSPGAKRRRLGRRVLAWLRGRGPMRKWLPSSRKGEAIS